MVIKQKGKVNKLSDCFYYFCTHISRIQMRRLKQHAANVIYLTVLCTVLATMFSSCSQENDDANTAEIELINKVWEYSKKILMGLL